MLKIRLSRDCLIFKMGIPIPGKDSLYIETEHWLRLCSHLIWFYMLHNNDNGWYCELWKDTPQYEIWYFNSLRPRLNRRPFADDIFKCFFLNENEWILPRISLKFAPKVQINNIPALVQIMAWRRPGDKPLSEPMMVSLLTHICITRPQWVNWKSDWRVHHPVSKILCTWVQ